MQHRRELVVGGTGALLFFVGAVLVGATLSRVELQVFSALVGLGAGGMFGTVLGLATHLARHTPEDDAPRPTLAEPWDDERWP